MFSDSALPMPAPPAFREALATLAHELRNPLHSVVLALELHTEDVNAAARKTLTMAARQARHAARMVEDLFDLCAGAGRRLSLRKEIVEVADVVAAATAATAHQFAAREHRLHAFLPARPVYLLADPLRLQQVLTNLLSNAAKFTDPGGHICLSAEAEAADVVLRVRDNGRGIDAKALPHVFELFWQAGGPDGTSTGGLGLGLALTKSLVELHGGSIAACSDGPGTGAEFIVRLPIHGRHVTRIIEVGDELP